MQLIGQIADRDAVMICDLRYLDFILFLICRLEFGLLIKMFLISLLSHNDPPSSVSSILPGKSHHQ